MHPNWARRLRDECAAAKVPFFFKQWGAWKPVKTIDALTSRGRGMLIDRDGKLPPIEAIDKLVKGMAQGSPLDLSAFVGRVHMKLIGKKLAGRELDGRTHDEYPA